MFLFRGVEVCDCDCHKEGRNIMHFMACCDLCGFDYINHDGSIKEEVLYKLLRMDFVEKAEVTYGKLKNIKHTK